MKTSDIVVGTEYYVSSDYPDRLAEYHLKSTYARKIVLATNVCEIGYRTNADLPGERKVRVITVGGVTYKVPERTFYRYQSWLSGRKPYKNGVLVARKDGRKWYYEIVAPREVQKSWEQHIADVESAVQYRNDVKSECKAKAKDILDRLEAAFGPLKNLPDEDHIPAELQSWNLSDLRNPVFPDGSIRADYKVINRYESLLWAYEKGKAHA